MNNLLNNLYDRIEKVKQEKHAEQHLTKYIDIHMGSNLHKAVTLHSDKPSSAIFDFVISYIDSAPDYLQAIYTLALESKTDSYVKPFVNLAYVFFIKPPTLLLNYQGLQRLLYQAYLSNRLLEELNDRITSFGHALSPLDISIDNVICHTLIGDELASQLDHLVLLFLETTAPDTSIFKQPACIRILKEMSQNNWQNIKQQWPCFNNDLGITLHVGSN